MTASEVVMKRDDDKIAWGFRLTGGSDLGSPFYVVKVLGRGHAERAGLRVGDLVYAINHKYINNFTHKDAQNAILHTGDTLILNIKRGPHGGRGTPLPEYADPLMGLAPIEPTPRPTPVPLPPYEPPPPVVQAPTPPESEDEEGPEETVAAFTVKINPKGRIAAIEELPVTPPPSPSSRCRSRSRSASAPRERRSSARREVMTQQAPENTFRPLENGFGLGGVHGPGGVQGPGEAFTYSKEVLTQYTKVFSASDQSEGQASEMINESFVIHGGSEHKMEDILSPEDIERDIFEEKMEDQKITELLTGEAEVLDQGIVGNRLSRRQSVLRSAELQEERIKKVESEEEQLRKDPNKRFSTFLQTPKRPVPKPKQKPPPVEELPWKKQLASTDLETETAQSQQNTQNMQTVQQVQQEETITSTAWTESVNIVEETTQFHEERQVFEQRYLAVSEEGGPIITEAVSTESVFEERVHFEDEPGNKTEDCSIQECKEETGSEQQKSEATNLAEESAEYKSETTSITEQTVEYKSEFERQLAEIQKQIRSIQELPSVLQANLTALQEQLTRIVEAKAAADQTQVEESEAKSRRGSSKSQLSWKIDVDMEETKEEVCNKESEDVENQYMEQDGANKENIEPPSEHAEEREEADTVEDLEHNKFIQNEQYENMKNIRLQKRDDDVSDAGVDFYILLLGYLLYQLFVW